MAAYDAPSRAAVPNLAGATGLQTLLLRIRDHQRHIYEWCREKRPDVGVVFPSLIAVAADKGVQEFTIYDLLKFTHSGAGLTSQGNVNDVCDAHQVHPHYRQWNIPNPWTSAVPAAVDVSPYHYWKACEEVRTWRAANGALPDNTRPLLATEVGIDYLLSGTGRTDLNQLRRLKYGMLTLGCLYYGCCLINLYAVGLSTATGYNLINPAASAEAEITFVGAGSVAGVIGTSAVTPAMPNAVIEQGDLLVCISYSRTSTGIHSSSWQTHTSLDTGPHFLLVSYKIAAGSGIDTPPTITPSGVAADQSNIAVVLAFRGVDQATPFGVPGANSNNAVAEDIGPISAATPLVTDGAALVIGCRNASSTGGIVSPLTGDGLTWVEAADGGFATNFGCHMAVDYTTWTTDIPALTAKTFDVATGLTGAGCGKMLLLRPAVLAAGGYFGSGGERDADYAFEALDAREDNDLIPFTAKAWQQYWRDWQVAFDASQDPIDGDATVCPFAEWNRVTMAGGIVTMTAGGRNVIARKKNLRRGPHTFSCEIRLTGAGSQACVRASGHDKLNGLALASSNVLVGPTDWTRVLVSFTPRQHNNPRIPDPRYAVLMIDHNGTGTCEARSPTIVIGSEDPPVPVLFYDLAVIDITWSPANPVAGEAVTFSATIFNNGNAPSPSGVIHGIGFSVDGTLVSWSAGNSTSLAARASRSQAADGGPGGIATWTAVEGTHSVQAYVDDANRMPQESDNSNNILVKSITVASAPTGTITPPAAAAAAGLTSLFFNDEFDNISIYSPNTIDASTGPNGTWRCNDYWMGDGAGYVDLGGLRHFNINQGTTDAAARATMQPYFPLSQPEPSVMRVTARRCRNNAGTAWLMAAGMRTIVENIANSQSAGLGTLVKWTGAQITTERVHPYGARDISRPAYIEFRVRWSPSTTGYWTSPWLFSSSENTKTSLEIDILEANDHQPSFFKTNVHHSGAGPHFDVQHNRAWADGQWHTIGCHWDQSFIRIYFDNILSGQFDSSVAGYFDQQLRLFFSLGGSSYWAASTGTDVPDSISTLTADLDYVRVWRPGASAVTVFPATGTLASAYTVTAGGQNSPVYPVTINTWYRNNPFTTAPGADEATRWANMAASNESAGFTAFEMSGTSPVPVTVRFNDRTVTSAKVYPARHGITPTISGGNTVNFNVTKPGKYIVMINNTEVRPCHVFVHPKDATAPTASGTGVVYYGPGTHNIGTITVANNTTYYIAGGARVVGNFNCGGRTGFKIKGRGIVQSSSNFLLGDGGSNFTIEGITILRPLGSTSDWTFKHRNCTDFTIDGVNVFTCEVTRDGIDSVSCRNYTIKNCFARSMDDPCCINAAFAGLGNIDQAVLEDCVFMPDSAIGGLEIGASMECAYARNITYRRIDMINPRAQCGISILNSDQADVYNIRYEDIHIDGFKGTNSTGSAYLARFEARQTGFSALPYQPGNIREIDLYNVTFINTDPALAWRFRYQGNSSFTIGPIRYHNLRINGTLITNSGQVTISNGGDVGTITYDTANP